MKCSYPEHLIDTEMKKVKFKSREKTEKSKSKEVPFVVTYHPSLNLFLPGPLVSFRNARNLVTAKLYPLHRKVGSKKCVKNSYEVCDCVTETDTSTSTVTGQSFKINHQLNCDDRCVIYLLTCKQCQKKYTGDFRYRWNHYKSNSRKFGRKESCMQEHLYRHFSSPRHRGFLNDV